MSTSEFKKSFSLIHLTIVLGIGIFIGVFCASIKNSMGAPELTNNLESSESPDTGNLATPESFGTHRGDVDSNNSRVDRISERLNSRLARWEKQVLPQYIDQLRNLGLDDQIIGNIAKLRSQLFEHASMDTFHRVQLLQKRAQLLRDIQNNTLPEQYEKYLRYEKVKAAQRELARMSENGMHYVSDLSQADREEMEVWIADLKLTTTETWDGPLDPLPNPLVGEASHIEAENNKIELFNNGIVQLINNMETAGYEKGVIDDIKSYYETELQNLEFQREVTSNPELRQSMLLAEMERLKSQQSQDQTKALPAQNMFRQTTERNKR